MSHVLLADIGGTNCRFVLAEVVENNLIERITETFPCKEYRTLCSIINRFLENKQKPILGIFAVAGVARGTSARFVNMGWDPIEDTSSNVKQQCGFDVVFLNDFEAAGYGCLALSSTEFVQLNPGVQPEEHGRIVVMGPGTGLGEALLTWTGEKYISWPGEGGHSDFAAHNEEQWRLARFMSVIVQTSEDYKHFRPCEHVSMEVCIAGVGAFHLYEFYRQERPDLADPEFDRQWDIFSKDDKLKHMMLRGFGGTDELCKKSVHLWLTLLGYECGNLITKNLPLGGVYLIGGMVTKNFSAINEHKGLFLRALNSKPRHIKEVISRIPLFLVEHSDVGLLGTRLFAKQYLKLN